MGLFKCEHVIKIINNHFIDFYWCVTQVTTQLSAYKGTGGERKTERSGEWKGGPLILVPFWLDQTMNAEVVSLYLAPHGGVQIHLSFIFLQKQMKLRKSHTTKFCTKNEMQFKQRVEIFQLRATILFDRTHPVELGAYSFLTVLGEPISRARGIEPGIGEV